MNAGAGIAKVYLLGSRSCEGAAHFQGAAQTRRCTRRATTGFRAWVNST